MRLPGSIPFAGVLGDASPCKTRMEQGTGFIDNTRTCYRDVGDVARSQKVRVKLARPAWRLWMSATTPLLPARRLGEGRVSSVDCRVLIDGSSCCCLPPARRLLCFCPLPTAGYPLFFCVLPTAHRLKFFLRILLDICECVRVLFTAAPGLTSGSSVTLLFENLIRRIAPHCWRVLAGAKAPGL